jgi:Delta14-sterol reductase
MSNPRTTQYEFFGPPGAFAISFGVPTVIYALYFGCSETAGGCPPSFPSILQNVPLSVQNPAWWKSLWDSEAAVLYFAWYAFCVVAWFVLPGDWVEGVTLRTGGKKKYKINGVS